MANHNLMLQELLSSDRGYFQAAADTYEHDSCEISVLPGLESLSAGCVVQNISPEDLPSNLDDWIEALEHRITELGSPHSRIYLQSSVPSLETVLSECGYHSEREFAVLKHAKENVAFESPVWLKPIENENDWETKRDVHAAMEICPDGHVAPSDLWVQMERAKCDAGYMMPFLIMNGEHVAGEVNVAAWGKLLRVKNLAIVPGQRLNYVARDCIMVIASMTSEYGCEACGAFVFKDAPAVKVYKKAGFDLCGQQQTEWFKPLV